MTTVTYDHVVTTTAEIDLAGLVLALDSALPGTALAGDDELGLLAVTDPAGHARMHVGPSRHVHDPVTAARHLGLGHVPGDQSWWTEITATGAGDLPAARSLARALADQGAGQVLDLGNPIEAAGTTPLAGAAPFDLVGGREAVLVQRRPVVSLGPVLHAAVAAAERSGRAAVLLTPPTTRLTPVVEHLVHDGALRWAVDDGHQAQATASATVLAWDGEGFAPAPGRPEATAVAADEGGEHGLVVDVDTLHPYPDPQTGTLTEGVLAALGAGPAEQVGTMEPPDSGWDRALVGAIGRRRSPGPVDLVVAAPRADGVLTIRPEPGGVRERVHLSASVEVADLQALGHRLLRDGAQLAVVARRPLGPERSISVATVRGTRPAMLALRTDRFVGLTADVLRGELGASVDVDGHALVATVPAHASPQISTGDRWLEVLALVARHDTLRGQAPA